jgi:hypothetical protein
MLHQLLLVLPVVGAVLATRCPRSPIGWIFLLSGAAQCLGGAIIDDRFAIMGHGTASAWAIVAERRCGRSGSRSWLSACSGSPTVTC